MMYIQRTIAASFFVVALAFSLQPTVGVAQDTTDTTGAEEQPATVVSTLQSMGNFDTLVSALQQTGLAEELSQGTYTVFAPTDDAFANADVSSMSGEELRSVLMYHVVSDAVSFDQAVDAGSVSTLQGGSLSVSGNGAVGQATVIEGNIDAGNGLIHVVDTVLIPEM